MAKRRLSQHQLRRISSNQQERGKRASLAALRPDDTLNTDELGPEADGIVICHYGQQLDIESCEPETSGQIFRCYQRSNLPALVTGDRVIWQPADKLTGVVVALDERSTVLSRPNAQGELRPVASNIDVVVVVIAPLPTPFANLIDRYLAAIANLSLDAVLLLNKAELLNAQDHPDLEPLLQMYQHIGYPVLRASCATQQGMEELRQALAGKTAVFVGQSGVGKSSLINTLRETDADDQVLEDRAAVGGLSVARDKGTHTTTATRLYHLPGSGDLIDSPGIREFGLWHMEPQQLLEGFIEFRPFIGHCKFRDCKHLQEPSCALRRAVQEGSISQTRLDSYFHIKESLLPQQH